jgi:hypothetical protein
LHSKDDESPNLGEQINQHNDNNDNNDGNNINNNHNSNNNNTNVANYDLQNLYRQELDKYKSTWEVDTINRKIKNSSGHFFRYEWVIEKGRYLIKLSDLFNSQPLYIFPAGDRRVFGFLDASDKRDLSSIRQSRDLINFINLRGFLGKTFDGSLFSSESVEKCSNKEFLFEQNIFKEEKKFLGANNEDKLLAFYELIRDNDQDFWNMRNNPKSILQDIQDHQQLKQQQNMMPLNNNNNNNMFNMGNVQQQMIPDMNMNMNMNMFNNMQPNNNVVNNNNQNMGNPQGMDNGFQGNNNNGFPQQMYMNNPQFPQEQQGQNNFFNNDGNGNNIFPQQ